MTTTAINCGSTLQLTTDGAIVQCGLPELHASAAHQDGTDNYEPASHQGVHSGQVYVWTSKDAGLMRTLRDVADAREVCDHMARKLAVSAALIEQVAGA